MKWNKIINVKNVDVLRYMLNQAADELVSIVQIVTLGLVGQLIKRCVNFIKRKV